MIQFGMTWSTELLRYTEKVHLSKSKLSLSLSISGIRLISQTRVDRAQSCNGFQGASSVGNDPIIIALLIVAFWSRTDASTAYKNRIVRTSSPVMCQYWNTEANDLSLSLGHEVHVWRGETPFWLGGRTLYMQVEAYGLVLVLMV